MSIANHPRIFMTGIYSTWFDKALKDPVYKEKYMTRHRRETNERSRRWKLAVLMHYSNGTMECACNGCSSAFIEFLTIDHIGRGKRETLSNTHRSRFIPVANEKQLS